MSSRFQAGTTYDGAVPSQASMLVFSGTQLLLPAELSADSELVVPTFYDVAAIIPIETETHYLGLWDDKPLFAVSLGRGLTAPDGWDWRDLRSLLSHIAAEFFFVAGRAIQLLEWARNHQYCGRCGSATRLDPAGERSRICTACGFGAYPRINPCVIGIVTRGDDILLARAHHFTNGMYSALAGFMEVGESAEQTLAREVKEEVGLDIRNIRYFGSQSWPFPSNLMLGFHADYAGGELVLQDDEIADANFYHYTELPFIPPHGSIARALIEHFIAERKAHHA